MSLMAVIAMICGPLTQPNFQMKADAKNCYVNMLNCIEHKRLNPQWTVDAAIQACTMEM